MSSFKDIWPDLAAALALFLEVGFLTCAYWIILRIFRHTQAIYTVLTVLFFWGGTFLLGYILDAPMPVFMWLTNALWQILPLVLLVLYHDEIRRFLAHPMIWVRRFTLLFRLRRNKKKWTDTVNRSADELLEAVCFLTTAPRWRAYLHDYYHVDPLKDHGYSGNVGALIAIEGVTGLEEARRNGVPLDCAINYQLLRTIFFDGTALHDGGVILRMTNSGLRITAAGCQFPMASKEDGPVHARTTAARGMAEKHMDAFVLMVSEESGSVLQPDKEDFRRMHRFDSPEELRGALLEFWLANANGLEESVSRDASETSRALIASRKETGEGAAEDESQGALSSSGKEE